MTDPTSHLAHRPLTPALRATAWQGRADTAVLAPVPGGRPRAEDVRQAVGGLADAGVLALFTPALAPEEQLPFAAAGFHHHEHLHLLRHRLDTLPARADVNRPADIRLRRGWWRDYPAVLAVDALAFDDFWRFDRRALSEARAATPTSRFRVATAGGRVTGYAVTGVGHPIETLAHTATTTTPTRRLRRSAYLQRLAVHPDHQGTGVGTALVADALSWARRRGAGDLLVNTQERNEGALRLYLRVGFTPQPHGLDVLRWAA